MATISRGELDSSRISRTWKSPVRRVASRLRHHQFYFDLSIGALNLVSAYFWISNQLLIRAVVSDSQARDMRTRTSLSSPLHRNPVDQARFHVQAFSPDLSRTASGQQTEISTSEKGCNPANISPKVNIAQLLYIKSLEPPSMHARHHHHQHRTVTFGCSVPGRSVPF